MEESLLSEIEMEMGKHVVANPFWLVCMLLARELHTRAVMETHKIKVTTEIEGHLYHSMIGV